ncbi:hypothetical protein C3Z13_02205 [Avibacterium endocarditidis]|uniref:Uncharacterized protein n=1 Tax=Avibacterium endocarditidis TaxID=380674 RepID=A0ABX4ZTU8_9PAST|nr:hypothetical protein C3Z13_02205 [Avibacterium endocarditidis]
MSIENPCFADKCRGKIIALQKGMERGSAVVCLGIFWDKGRGFYYCMILTLGNHKHLQRHFWAI